MVLSRSTRVAVVMPAYNEEALDEFLAEIEAAVRPVVADLRFVVVDDASTSELPSAVLPLGSPVLMLRNETNLGHGPSALRAYVAGLATSPDVVIHVDGDGQFLGADFVELLTAAVARDGVVGARTGRVEPWFRRYLTLGARILVGGGLRGADVNSPLRIYQAPALRQLLARVSSDSVVPHLHFAVLHSQLNLDVCEIGVTHRPRRGTTALGTTWQSPGVSLPLPSRRLLRLAGRALHELRQRRKLDPAPELVVFETAGPVDRPQDLLLDAS
jgi:dolichol-phosphate mannosyltransferase